MANNDHPVVVDQLSRECMRLLRLMKKAAARFAARQDNGIEFAAYGLLMHLVCEGPMRTTDLAGAVHTDPSTVSRQAAALVRNGLLERRADPLDGRASLLAATPAGIEFFDANRERRNIDTAKILAQWDQSEVDQLVTLLARLNNDFEEYDREQDDYWVTDLANAGEGRR